jgi:hypothetical protein
MKQAKMIQMRQKAMEIQDRLMSSDIEVVKVAEKDLERLLEAFYAENKDMLAPEQYEQVYQHCLQGGPYVGCYV